MDGKSRESVGRGASPIVLPSINVIHIIGGVATESCYIVRKAHARDRRVFGRKIPPYLQLEARRITRRKETGSPVSFLDKNFFLKLQLSWLVRLNSTPFTRRLQIHLTSLLLLAPMGRSTYFRPPKRE
ncbi:uncharacterized protein LOC122530921 [Frieseomelitta varia]|uniref:uncharacterized protein LOC122530921 n=1 Tax=Frieseomelitta varia TaxID=561572 RepID=UPI001CB69147|nr:uncharacterized protein LOC122530921 [Frieseomelitta varia]